MDAVGKLGSYISRSVYTVSAPFHPFGGAVDIIVVEQPDGSFKSSPWYVQFGKFQGVLKAKERVVSIHVNGIEADFHMYMDHKGEAHFLREVDVEDADSLLSPASSGEDMDGHFDSRRPIKSKSCNYDAYQDNSVAHIDVSDGSVVTRTNSRRSRILRFVFGRRSVKENSFSQGDDGSGFVRRGSLESAEIAADLLEVKWSTSLVSSRRRKDNVSQLSCQLKSEENAMKDLIMDVEDDGDSLTRDTMVDNPADSTPLEQIGSSGDEKDHSSHSSPTESKESTKEAGAEISCLATEYMTITSLVERDSKSSEGNDLPQIGSNERGFLCTQEFTKKNDCFNFSGHEKRPECDEVTPSLAESGFITKTFSRRVTFLPPNGLVEDVQSQSTSTFSTLESPSCQSIVDRTMCKETDMILESPTVQLNDTVGSYGRRSGSPEAEQLFFGDLDEFKAVEPVKMEVSISQHNEGQGEPLGSQIKAAQGNVCGLSDEWSSQKDLSENPEGTGKKLKGIPGDFNIHEAVGSPLDKYSRGSRSLPNMTNHHSGFGEFGHALEDAQESDSSLLKQTWVCDYLTSNIKSETENDHQPSMSSQMTGDVRNIENGIAGSSSRPFDPSTGNWKSLSFPFNKSRSMKYSEAPYTSGSDAQNVAKREDRTDDERDVPQVKVTKRKIKATTPTSEELASLNLKEGSNIVAFTFSTPMLGNQQVDARIHLWKWDSRIVISDVDGTITRSDLLGQVMPLVGVDWSQTGVAHLFSAVKENGYHVLFLSARAISQAYHTRRFLCNLKQDGKALPDGPVVISPDGLFPSLYREVVRRAPHEFKISCLEAIRALFPPDRNPFYAGFGNRDTDEISYLKVGIPRGKIFIINPKGEIVVNRRIDRKSYTSLHALVNDMFPLMCSSEQEDFNSWNYWKLPPPAIEI